MSGADEMRRAAALRENLRRRKQQRRGRAEETMAEARLRAAHEFWFHPGDDAMKPRWFEKNPEFDTAIRDRFGADIAAAASGRYDAAAREAVLGVGLIVLLDQFPRNVFRGTAQAFAADPRALSLARRMVAEGWDQARPPIERVFVYLPFVHSEVLADQEEALRLIATIPERPWKAECAHHAQRHLDVIARYGRFPHRNAALGRESTAAEREYLAQPGAGF